MNPRSAPDIGMLLGKFRTSYGVGCCRGDCHEAANARLARLGQHAVKPFVDSVVQKMAVGIDHG
jgi:hypothetical protein